MAEARGLRDVKPKAGTFVLAALLVATTGVFFAGRARGWFEPTLRVRSAPVPLPADSTLGLQSGAEVQLLGNTVGTVDIVDILEDPAAPGGGGLRLQFVIQVRGPQLHLVRRDSTLLIKRKFGVAGSAFVQIVPGLGEPAAAGAELACKVAPDITAVLEETLNSFGSPDSPAQLALRNVETLTSNLVAGRGVVGRLLSDQEASRNLESVLANVDKLTSGMARGEGVAGKLLSDAKTGDQLAEAVTNISGSLASTNKLLARTQGADIGGFLDQLRQTLSQVDAALREVTVTTATLRLQAKDLPALVGQTQEMMRQTTRMIEGVQKTWLLRDYVTPESASRLSPIDVTSP